MITNIKQFITERNKNPEAFKINESFDELEAGAPEVEGDDLTETPEEGVTVESFTEMLNAEHERMQTECEESGEECPEALTTDQVAMVFNVVEPMLADAPEENAEDIAEITEEVTGCNDDEENEENEEIEEGKIGDWFRGGSKEEIEAKKQEVTAKLQEIEKKYAGKELLFKDYGGNDKPVEFKLADALKIAGKNNYLGTVQVIKQGDKFVAMWRDGKKGMHKVAAGTRSQTSGQ